MGIRNRRAPRDLIHHSDRGVHCACGDDRKLLALRGITASMSRKSNCLDNAPMIHAPRAPLRDDIEILYNRRRRNSTIGDRVPALARTDMVTAWAA
ncbi:MAG: hypothetical protein AAGC57_20335 [Pseudomonadota bacterium]